MSLRRATGSQVELCTNKLAWSFRQNPNFPGFEEWAEWCKGSMDEVNERKLWSKVVEAIGSADVDSFSRAWQNTAGRDASMVQEIGKLYRRLKRKCEAGKARFGNEPQSTRYVAESYCSGLHPGRRGQAAREMEQADLPDRGEEDTRTPPEDRSEGEERQLAQFAEEDVRAAVLETVRNTLVGVLLRHWSVLVELVDDDPLSALEVLFGRQHWGEWRVPGDSGATLGDVLQRRCCKKEANMHKHASRLRDALGQRKELGQALGQILKEEE